MKNESNNVTPNATDIIAEGEFIEGNLQYCKYWFRKKLLFNFPSLRNR